MRHNEAQYLRPDEIVAERRKNSLVFLPLAPLEWHGPHLPLGVDPLRAEFAAKKLAAQLGGIVMPTLYMGTERERSAPMLASIGLPVKSYVVGMDFPANSLPSLYFKEEVFALALRNYLDLLISGWQFKNVVIVNGHGAENQIYTLTRLQKEFTSTGRTRIIVVMPMVNFPNNLWSHATREETSTVMHGWPETVELRALPPRPRPLRNTHWAIIDDQTFRGSPARGFRVRDHEDPRKSTAAEGKRMFDVTIRQLAALIRKELRLGRRAPEEKGR
jgi:creatinine amidohydrolase